MFYLRPPDLEKELNHNVRKDHNALTIFRTVKRNNKILFFYAFLLLAYACGMHNIVVFVVPAVV